MSKYEIYDLFENAPNWLRLSIVLSIVYLTYSFWSLLVRFNRERRLASRILEERRKAGIPDTDTRPFRIAKAAVEKKRNESADEHVHKTRVTFSSGLLDDIHPKETDPGPSQNAAFEASNASTTSKPRRRPSSTHETRSKSLRDLPFTRMSPTSSTGPATTTTTFPSEGQHKLAHSLRSKNKRTASAYAPSEASPGGSPETLTHTHTRTTKKVKTKSTIKSPNKRGLPTQTELNRKKTKLSVPGDLSIQDEQMDFGSDSQGEEVESVMIEKGKKRILSDAVSETDLQADELKNKRGKSIKQTEEDQVEDDRNDKDHSSQLDEDQEIDKDVFMITDDGQKKKLIKIRQVLDVGDRTDQIPDEDTIERRWVTRTEFESLKQAGQLLISDELWDDRSTTPSEAMNMSIEFTPSSNSNVSLITRPDTEFEDGPIWSIEGKPSSRIMSTENSVAIKLRPGSRPRNSLGRMRLSLPPDPTSPAPRSRSKMGSLIHDDRYINDKPSVEKQVAIISPTTETSSQPNANKDVSRTSTQPHTNIDVSRTSTQPLSILPFATQLPIEPLLQNQSYHLPVSSASLQSSIIPAASSATANTPGQQLFSGPTRIGNVDLPVSAPKVAPDFSFGSTSSSTQKSTPSTSQPSVAATNNLASKVFPTSTSPSLFGFTSTTANTGSGGFSFGSNNLSTVPKESTSNATPITSTPLFGATSTNKPGDALSTTSTGKPGVPSFSFNSSPLPAPPKEATTVSSAFNLNNGTPKETCLTTENSIAQPPKANPSTTSSFPALGGTLGTTFNPTFAPNKEISKSPSIFGNSVTQNQSSKPFQSTNTTPTTTTSAFGATSGATTFSFGAPTSPMVSSTTKQVCNLIFLYLTKR
ncbi:hypothetical protein CROQUDRAFT_257592 [Cronartium quercuum f. sp. fusiforme G11]|uniref:Uncharacterized protein n=1 Tax=Cronartium quercuum f. sp. fusiforme G11 TaxID=708437 RepID=A0A9P6N9U7_9BASI|nr:hypothetical protein CROQUDRAFT_257592 [Cronartium quercuum f. sp. fusiforme G11]